MLSPCPAPPPAMLSKFFGGKFKYLNRKNSEFLAGNSNANVKCKMQMQNANAKCKCKCKMLCLVSIKNSIRSALNP